MRQELTTLAAAQATHERALSLFRPMTDLKQHGRAEKWSDCFAAMKAGKAFVGDCDDFAITCLHWLHERYGVPLDQLSLVVCRPQAFGGAHLVTLVDGWVLDNLQREVLHKNRLSYKWISVWDLTSPTNWRGLE